MLLFIVLAVNSAVMCSYSSCPFFAFLLHTYRESPSLVGPGNEANREYIKVQCKWHMSIQQVALMVVQSANFVSALDNMEYRQSNYPRNDAYFMKRVRWAPHGQIVCWIRYAAQSCCFLHSSVLTFKKLSLTFVHSLLQCYTHSCTCNELKPLCLRC